MKTIKILTIILISISILIVFAVVIKAVYSAIEMILMRQFIAEVMINGM